MEVELQLDCETCGTKYTLVHETDVDYAPEHCPFCGEFVSLEDEEEIDDEEEEDEDE